MTGRPLRFALLADGPSDRALLHVIRWVLAQKGHSEFAQPGFRSREAKRPMAEEMRATIALFGPDILFVHRDAEGEDPEVRRREIPDAQGTLVRIVPVRMTEAWLLFDERAIRIAAGNPSGTAVLRLPPWKSVEEIADPKVTLREALLAAAEVTGRRRKHLRRDLPGYVQRVAELIADFNPLRQLPAFRRFEADCAGASSP